MRPQRPQVGAGESQHHAAVGVCLPAHARILVPREIMAAPLFVSQRLARQLPSGTLLRFIDNLSK